MTEDEQGRLQSGKAFAASLMLAGVLLAALALFLWVVFQHACSGDRGVPRAAILRISELGASI